MTTGKAVSLSPVGSRVLRVRVFNLADADARLCGMRQQQKCLRTQDYDMLHR